MGRAPIQPSVVVGQLLRERRKELGMTYREVSGRLAKSGFRLPASTLVRIEQGKLDPGVRRLHRLLRLYRVPPHLVEDLLQMEDLAGSEPVKGDLETLHREGVAAWKRGDFGKALACLNAVRRRVPDTPESRLLRQKVTLSFAVAARNGGKLRLARHLVDDLLCEPPDSTLVLSVLLLASSVWQRLGSHDAGIAFARQAATHLTPKSHRERAWVCHQNATLLLAAGRFKEALGQIGDALEAYRALRDTYEEAKILLLQVDVLAAMGKIDKGEWLARKTIQLARRHGHPQVVLTGRLKLGRLLIGRRATAEGLATIQDALGQAVLQRDRHAQFLAHYHLWKAHAGLGDEERARVEIEAAGYYVRFVDEASPEADEIRDWLEKQGAPGATRPALAPRRP